MITLAAGKNFTLKPPGFMQIKAVFEKDYLVSVQFRFGGEYMYQ